MLNPFGLGSGSGENDDVVGLKDLKNLVPQVDLTRPSTHSATLKFVPKANGDERAVVRFGLVDQARQEMLRRAVAPWVTEHRLLPYQHAVTNGGRDAACRKRNRAL